MDVSTVMQNLNWYAVVAAALSTFIIGGAWYAIFEKSWMDANKFTSDNLKERKMPMVFALSFVLSFIMALNLAMFIGNQGLAYGFMAGFLAGFGWVTLAIAIIALFEKRPLKYVLINGGYMLVSFSVMGVILGAWK
jgi:hypothetical protein